MGWTSKMRTNRYPNVFNKHGDRRSNVCYYADVQKKEPQSQDTKNRNEVANQIMELVNNGMSLGEACEKMVKEHKDKFKYLPEENLAQIFAGWYKGRARAKKEKEETERGF